MGMGEDAYNDWLVDNEAPNIPKEDMQVRITAIESALRELVEAYKAPQDRHEHSDCQTIARIEKHHETYPALTRAESVLKGE